MGMIKNIAKEALLYNNIYKYLLEGAYRKEATKDEKRMIRSSSCKRSLKMVYCFERASGEKEESSG